MRLLLLLLLLLLLAFRKDYVNYVSDAATAYCDEGAAVAGAFVIQMQHAPLMHCSALGRACQKKSNRVPTLHHPPPVETCKI